MKPLLKIGKRKTVAPQIDKQLRTLFDNSKELKICMIDPKGRIIAWNESAVRLTGYTPEDVVGKKYSMFISKEEDREHVFEDALQIAKDEGLFSAEGIRVRKDGSHFWARLLMTPVKGRNGNVKFFVLITRDITQERRVEQRKEEYIGIASHELKTPITTLSLYSELLAKRLQFDSDKKNLHMLHDIQGQTNRLVTLVDELLLVSKIEGGTLELHKEVFNPKRLIRKIIADFQKTSKRKIICTGKFEHEVRADKPRIAQVLTNLLSNAIKYSPLSEKVIVHVGSYKKKCLISIQDFGAGMAKSDQIQIFTRFYRGNDAETGNVAGSGLGLYISKEIITRHHEKLWVESVEGRGTTFSFTLSFV